MFILAIDPGITTGWAALDLDGRILDVGEFSPENIDLIKVAIGVLDDDFEVVIEHTPTPTMGSMNMTLRDVIARLRLMFPKHVEVKPGQWKQTPVVRHSVPSSWGDGDTILSAHMKDAIRIGIYYITFMREGR